MRCPDCDSCPLPDRLRARDDLIVELQHALREMRHEIDNQRAAEAGWPGSAEEVAT